MSQRKARKPYNRPSMAAREKLASNVINSFPLSENMEGSEKVDYVAISDTIQHISRTSPRDLAYLKSPIKSPRVSLSSKITSSPITSSPTRSPPKSPIQSPIKTPIRSPRLKSPINSPIRSPIKSPRLNSPKLNNSKEIINLTPSISNFIQSTPKKSVESIYEKRTPVATIETLDSEVTPVKRVIHKVSRDINRESTRASNNTKDGVEREVEKIITNNDYKSVSSRLPRIENKSVKFTPTPRKDEFVPSYGDTFTRNGITYVYDDNGWRALEAEEMREEVKPKLSVKSSLYKDIPNYSILSQEQQIYLRTKFSIKFDMMRETWPQYEIPSLSADVPLEHIHIMYNHYVKHIYARENAQTYELYMIVGWIAMQTIAVKLLGLPAQGFYKFRANRMGKYRMLLIQLGEKYHGEFGEGWPVEIKILVMSVLEIVIFIALKMLLSLGDEGNESAVSFISDLIDRHFGITGVSNSVSDTAGLIVRTPEVNPREVKSGIPPVNIPSLPEEPNDISNITTWFPTITSKLGIDSDKTETKQDNKGNNAAEKIRARAANRSKQYSPPPFNY